MLAHSENQLRQVSRMTGGQVYKYTYFQVISSHRLNQLLTIKLFWMVIRLHNQNATNNDYSLQSDLDGERFISDLHHNISRFNFMKTLFPKYLFPVGVDKYHGTVIYYNYYCTQTVLVLKV